MILFAILEFTILPSVTLFQVYHTLSTRKKLEWNSRTMSSIHAIIVAAIGLIVIFWRTTSESDKTWLNDPLATFNIALSTGYLLTDLVYIFVFSPNVAGDSGFIIHHTISISAFLLSITQGYLSYYANFRIISEASTPFLNFRWNLYTIGNEKSSMYFWNGIALLVAFSLCRIIPIPYFWYDVYYLVQTESYKTSVGPGAHVGWLGVCFVLDILNLHWFTLLVKRSLKFLQVKED